MVDLADVDFSDEKSLEGWFKGQSVETRCMITSRAALRVLANVGLIDAEQKETLALTALRATLTSAGRGLGRPADVEDLERAALSASTAALSASTAALSASTAARSASTAARSASARSASTAARSASTAARSASTAARSASTAALSASTAARSASTAARSASAAARSASARSASASTAASAALSASTAALSFDVDHDIGVLRPSRVWAGADVPEAIADNHAAFLIYLDSHNDWQFWRRWYNQMWEGTFTDWGLAIEVAKIPDAVWEEGLSAVAEAIREIEARFVADVLSERIAFTSSGRLTLIPQDFAETPLLGRLIDTVRDALDLATSGLRNELAEDGYQARLLRQTFRQYANDPQRLEMDFERARVSLIQDMASDDIPTSPANRDLVQSLSDAALAIRDENEDIAKNRERLNRLRLGEISEEDGGRIADVAGKVAEVADEVFAGELLLDRSRLPGVRRDDKLPDPVIPVGIPERNAALEAQAAQIRLASRLAHTWLYLRSFDRDELGRLMGTPEVQLLGFLASIIGIIVTLAAM